MKTFSTRRICHPMCSLKWSFMECVYEGEQEKPVRPDLCPLLAEGARALGKAAPPRRPLRSQQVCRTAHSGVLGRGTHHPRLGGKGQD